MARPFCNTNRVQSLVTYSNTFLLLSSVIIHPTHIGWTKKNGATRTLTSITTQRFSPMSNAFASMVTPVCNHIEMLQKRGYPNNG